MDNEMKTSKAKRITYQVLLYTSLTIFAIFIVIPFYWMILTALKSDIDLVVAPPILFLKPGDIVFQNFVDAFARAPFGRNMINTVLVAFISTTGTIITTVLASFAFARLNFRGRELLFLIFLSTMMIPGEIFIITNFNTVAQLGWLGADEIAQTYRQALQAMTFPFMTSVFYIFFLRQTFKGIPDELYLAAKVDGTSDFKYLWKIMIPIAKPTIITITILNAMGSWNAYIWPNLVIEKSEFRLVTDGLRNAYTELAGGTIYNEQMAAALIITLPLLIVFLLLKSHIMRGVSRSGIKG
ncbi:carbohydrate ABC transporter permease [Candidatus Xianfuyuplasma coldseepsis]|uniref:Carbohydrate ABC transporter permease n=1 Tax=Candidatus Xianfuyuplasma coldseepsis TaxID=2782163 RepID=A0A7L7KTA1_9MOLU|nr:carbohydrate ABC transporter permease [Xianfuyuplasma coldseepsis]QMS84978.1 carbohydrate ABC transporter permease [Xianfuyuplasma coldseepsis]